MPDLFECPPCCDADQKANDQRKDLPRQWIDGDDACRHKKNRCQEWAEMVRTLERIRLDPGILRSMQRASRPNKNR